MEKIALRAARFLRGTNIQEGLSILQEIGIGVRGTANLMKVKDAVRTAMLKPPYWKAFSKATKTAQLSPGHSQKPKRQNPKQKPPVSKSKDIADNGPIDEKSLGFRIRKLATARAILSNQLEDPKGNPVIIAKNSSILDRIEPIVDEIQQLEEQKGRPLIPQTEEGDRIVIMRKGESYTANQLDNLLLPQLTELKSRLIRDLFGAEASIKNSKKEKTREANRIKAQSISLELNLISNVITAKKNQARTQSANI
ncbi:MAG: hypothetical protein AAFP92_29800 [Bacteroidota bacterium]